MEPDKQLERAHEIFDRANDIWTKGVPGLNDGLTADFGLCVRVVVAVQELAAMEQRDPLRLPPPKLEERYEEIIAAACEMYSLTGGKTGSGRLDMAVAAVLVTAGEGA